MSHMRTRSWFRFHLATAIAMMLASAGFAWANCISHHYDLIYNSRTRSYHIDSSEIPDYAIECYGWPESFYADNTFETHFLIKPFVLDAIVFCEAIAGVAMVSEFILRRREGAKQF